MKFDINDYKGKYVMHCKTEAEATDFCNYLHSIGKRWNNVESYLNNPEWYRYTTDSVYLFNSDLISYVDYAKRNNYTILEWSDFINKKFTKADLKTGDIVMQRDGTIQITNRELGMFITNDWWNDMDSFNSELINYMDEQFDIIAVRRPQKKSDCTFQAFKNESGILIYKRKEAEEVEEMTLDEVCKLLGKEIKIIK